MDKFDVYAAEYSKLVLELNDYDKASNIINNKGYDYKVSVNLGKKIDRVAVKLIDLDLEKFITLLDNKNIAIRGNCAEYLYPLFPKKCLKILCEFEKSFNKEIDRIKIHSKIVGLQRNDKFFIELYKNLYKVEDLSMLNREK